MINRIIDAIIKHYGIKEDQVEKIKSIIDMVEFKEENDQKFLFIRLGDGVELKIKQDVKED
jgi:hypothetical protein